MRAWKIGSFSRSTPWKAEMSEATAAPKRPAGRITQRTWPKETPIVSTTTHMAAVAAEIGEAEMAIWEATMAEVSGWDGRTPFCLATS